MTDTFKTERDMCAAFITAIDRRKDEDWVVYPETCGFDMVLVRKADGFQVGIEAKLRLNAKVVAQILPTRWDGGAGPDCRGVLVPSKGIGQAFKDICDYIGITIISIGESPSWGYLDQDKPIKYRIQPDLPEIDRDQFWWERWHEWAPECRLPLPEVVPDCDAGCPAPLQLTPWKIKAIKIAILLERFGEVSRTDFKDLEIDPGRWTSGSGWLCHSRKEGRRTIYAKGEHMPDFKGQHPKNYDEIAASIDEWLPENRKTPLLGEEK